MILYNKTSRIMFWTISCLPIKVHRGRAVPFPKITLEPNKSIDLSKVFTKEEVDLILEKEKLPTGLSFKNKTLIAKSKSEEVLPKGTKSVLNRIKGAHEVAETSPEIEIETVSEEDINALEATLATSTKQYTLPEDDGITNVQSIVVSEDPPTKEELEAVDGKRPLFSWKKRLLWVWAHENGLEPKSFANKSELWELIKSNIED